MHWGVKSTLMLAALGISAASACQPVVIEPTTGTYEREVRGGRFIQHSVTPFQSAGDVHVDELFPPNNRELERVLGELSPSDFIVSSRVDDVISGRGLAYITMKQAVDGIPIEGTYLNFTVRPGADDKPGQALASAYHLYHHPEVDTELTVRGSDAAKLARGTLRVPESTTLSQSELMIRDIHGKLQLVWSVGVVGSHEVAMVYANGEEAGRVDVIDDRVYETFTGQANGYLAVGGAPGSANASVENRGLANLEIKNGDTSTFTAADGSFAIDGVDGDTLTTRLSGRAAHVVDMDGADLTASAAAANGALLELGDAASTQYALAQVTAYYYVDATLTYLESNGFDTDIIGDPLTTNVNINDACNAYFSPSARTINFYKSGSVGSTACNNSAEATIIAHEYGHFVDDTFGGITNGGLSEGWGDVLACYSLNEAVVGGDLFTDGSIIRTCDNDYQYPASGSDEVHALGQAWAGFTWHAREMLIAQYGEAEGDAIARALVLPSLVSNAADIPAAVREVILRDDDDGDLSNHTPNWDLLRAAADLHALGFVFDSDLVAPASISDLTVASVSATKFTLEWTATGDDGMDGTASAYDLRISEEPITEGNFAAATQVSTGAPLESGSPQQLTVSAAPEATLYAAIKVLDETGNVSPLSNVVDVTTSAGKVVWSDGAEDGLGDWTADGLWHVTSTKASEGSNSFWYGKEDTGNYDTGAANSGTLSSPVVDLSGAISPVLVLSEYIDVESFASYDKLTITVVDVNDETVSVSVEKDTGTTLGEFRTRVVALPGMEDRQVQMRLHFDTVDNLYNDMEGWFVDDVRFISDEPVDVPEGKLVINEVLADPAPDYDANGDGYRDAREDEFIELVNVGEAALDLSGATISDAVTVRFTFPEGTLIEPGYALVVFGGGTPTLEASDWLVADGLYLNNGGDSLFVHRADGELLAEMTYGSEGGNDASLTRATDADSGSPFVHHATVGYDLASPGTMYDMRPFGPGHAVINEVLADPPADYDANGDGYRDAVEDEFIEIVNAGASTIDLSGATVSDGVGVRVTLPDGMILTPGRALVIFGGGTPAEIGGVPIVVGTLGLNNSGDSVTLAAADGTVLDAMTYGTLGGQDSSLVRQQELNIDAPFVLHSALSGVASPGHRINGKPF